MNKEQQIEEMARVLCKQDTHLSCHYTYTECDTNCSCVKFAKILVNAGYGDVGEYEKEIERLSGELAHREEDLVHADEKIFYRECNVVLREKEIKEQAVKEFAKKLRGRIPVEWWTTVDALEKEFCGKGGDKE